MVKLAEVIDVSLEWTKVLLFRSFRPKKWLILTFIALMAGYMSSGQFSLNNFDNIFKSKDKQSVDAGASETQGQQAAQAASADITVTSTVILLFLAMIALIVLFTWLGSRFNLIFIHSLCRNDATIRGVFGTNKAQGNSFFQFSLILSLLSLFISGAIALACFLTLNSMGVFKGGAKEKLIPVILICFAYAVFFLASIILSTLAGFIARAFLLLVMFKDRIRIKEAWQKFKPIFRAHKSDFIRFIFMKIGLGVCCWIIYSLISIPAMVAFFWPLAAIVLLLAGIFQVIPQGAMQIVFIISSLAVVLPCGLFLFYCLYCLHLPFSVFLRTLDLKFFSRVSPEHNLFKYMPQGGTL